MKNFSRKVRAISLETCHCKLYPPPLICQKYKNISSLFRNKRLGVILLAFNFMEPPNGNWCIPNTLRNPCFSRNQLLTRSHYHKMSKIDLVICGGLSIASHVGWSEPWVVFGISYFQNWGKRACCYSFFRLQLVVALARPLCVSSLKTSVEKIYRLKFIKSRDATHAYSQFFGLLWLLNFSGLELWFFKR